MNLWKGISQPMANQRLFIAFILVRRLELTTCHFTPTSLRNTLPTSTFGLSTNTTTLIIRPVLYMESLISAQFLSFSQLLWQYWSFSLGLGSTLTWKRKFTESTNAFKWLMANCLRPSSNRWKDSESNWASRDFTLTNTKSRNWKVSCPLPRWNLCKRCQIGCSNLRILIKVWTRRKMSMRPSLADTKLL